MICRLRRLFSEWEAIRRRDHSSRGQMRLPAIAKRLDHEREGRRVLPAARIVQVVRRAWRAPVRQNPDQLPLSIAVST